MGVLRMWSGTGELGAGRENELSQETLLAQEPCTLGRGHLKDKVTPRTYRLCGLVEMVTKVLCVWQ